LIDPEQLRDVNQNFNTYRPTAGRRADEVFKVKVTGETLRADVMCTSV